MAGIAMGFREVFEPERHDRTAIEQPAPEQPWSPGSTGSTSTRSRPNRRSPSTGRGSRATPTAEVDGRRPTARSRHRAGAARGDPQGAAGGALRG